MEFSEINLNKIKSEEVLEIYNKTKEFIESLEKDIEEVKEKDA